MTPSSPLSGRLASGSGSSSGSPSSRLLRQQIPLSLRPARGGRQRMSYTHELPSSSPVLSELASIRSVGAARAMSQQCRWLVSARVLVTMAGLGPLAARGRAYVHALQASGWRGEAERDTEKDKKENKNHGTDDLEGKWRPSRSVGLEGKFGGS
jgi:hypothetical protein